MSVPNDTRTFKKGQRVRFTGRGPMGTVERPAQHYFEDEVVMPGDEGVVEGQHPTAGLEDWLLVAVTVNGRDLFCPVHVSSIEPIAEPS